MSKHLTGLWTVRLNYYQNKPHPHAVFANSAEMGLKHPAIVDSIENALLIAAAPDMFSAIQGAILGITRHADDTYTIGVNAVAILQAVIAKAEGGGPAFPVREAERFNPKNNETHAVEQHWGMTLRDYFAAKALVGILSFGRKGGPKVCDNAARDAYDFADAMLAEREKGGGQ